MPVRRARPGDVPAVHALIRALAEYERSADQVESSAADLYAALFGARPSVSAHVALDDAGEVVGFAVWFVTYSTWTGRHGIWLEDLFVLPGHRRAGHGRALLAALAQEAVEQGWRRLEWSVLDWNEPAIGFYRSVGALPLDEWTTHRLSGAELESLAAEADR